jgi:hypothetical protein
MTTCTPILRAGDEAMADYREISQDYAQGGIKAVVLLNGGASVAVLSQISKLPMMAASIAWAMAFWDIGLVAGALTWLFGFMSARYVDKHEREGIGGHLDASNKLMNAGLVAIVISLLLFVAGSAILGIGFSEAYPGNTHAAIP